MSGSSRCSIHSCVLLLLGQLKEGKQARMPPSAVHLAKRALVVLLHALAQVYDVRAVAVRAVVAVLLGAAVAAVGRSWCLGSCTPVLGWRRLLVNQTEQLCCNKSASSNFIDRRWLLFLSKPQNSEFP